MNNMRMVVATALALSLSMVGAAPAAAVTVTRADGMPMLPTGEPFSALGSVSFYKGSVSMQCFATIVGTVRSTGFVEITAARYDGAGPCSLLNGTASNMQPWTGQFDSPVQVSINNMAVSVMLLGSCGPNKVIWSWNNSSSSMTSMSAVLFPDCTTWGTLQLSPRFVVQ
ncbi:hypothetical protein PI87_11085 [Ralstonia sp. A12]|uniref:hypothetical protein n=1 Tax=Ralstonia sp. A12 TaxID=1217052 RepID=UPI0005747574|nr:hypothetical protein [Ralstonia sp. A12]KHK56254.1 hypothetical protein PI87_11085 [Ralstonia sp. A12]